jgi:hypothetical protein
VLRVLVDADNVSARRLQPVLDLLSALADGDGTAAPVLRLTASGSAAALRRLDWPAGSELLEHAGWQRADLALATAYSPEDAPLLLVSGDGDFALLAARHPGSVLVVSGAPSGRLRDIASVVDPATDGVDPIADWLRAQGVLAP